MNVKTEKNDLNSDENSKQKKKQETIHQRIWLYEKKNQLTRLLTNRVFSTSALPLFSKKSIKIGSEY